MLNAIKMSVIKGVVGLAVAVVPAFAVAQTRTFTVNNDTRWTIEHVYVSPSGDPYWHEDQLGSKVLPPDYWFKMSIVPGWYDVKLVDEDGDSCTLKGLDFRAGETWTMTDQLLALCELVTHD
jgi:hypothetical protein